MTLRRLRFLIFIHRTKAWEDRGRGSRAERHCKAAPNHCWWVISSHFNSFKLFVLENLPERSRRSRTRQQSSKTLSTGIFLSIMIIFAVIFWVNTPLNRLSAKINGDDIFQPTLPCSAAQLWSWIFSTASGALVVGGVRDTYMYYISGDRFQCSME